MRVAVTIIMVLSIAFIGNAVHEFQDTGLLNATSLLGVLPRLPCPIAEFSGFHPTSETLIAQLALLGVYVVGGIILWWRSHRPARPTPLRQVM